MSNQINKDKYYSKRLAERYPEFVKDAHSWAAMVEKYADDVKNWDGSPQMLRLVQWIATQEYASMFHPYTSLMRLCISTKAEFGNQGNSDAIVIWHDTQLSAYQIKYYEKSNQKPERRMCKESEIQDIVELKLLRMKLVAAIVS